MMAAVSNAVMVCSLLLLTKCGYAVDLAAESRGASVDRRIQTSIGRTGLLRRESDSFPDSEDTRPENGNTSAVLSWLQLQGRSATQKNTADGPFQAGLVIDGSSSTCSKTVGHTGNWWEIDLGDSYQIGVVQVSSTADISGLKVYLDKRLCPQGVRFPRGKAVDIPCNDTARKVYLRRGNLALCDVKVMTQPKWHVISNQGVCEDVLWLRTRLTSRIQGPCGDFDDTFETCKHCCLHDRQCHAIDWFPRTSVCNRFTMGCNASDTTRHDGSSYMLERR
eukprot:TRINITY_DN50284_c0_g1_i1.p1 TRINITY_DN50284_c0_g1~~TRINITY_DN50284_c0_g1_i1.p1  ORF type:complete len:278 (+),score=26.10 TRINITY_DN50284_c0_g1_i1:48-881(+)